MGNNELANVGTGAPAIDSGYSADVAPNGSVANDLFRRMQAAKPEGTPAADAAKSEETKPETKDLAVQTPEASTAAALADAGKAPESKPEAKDAKKTSESIRALVKASNIPAEFKEEVTALAYQGKAAQEAGLSQDVIKTFKDMGVSIQSVVERIRLHPAIDDAKRDALLAGEHRTLISDIINNPKKFVQNIRATIDSANRPEVKAALVGAFAENIEKEARQLWISKLDREFRAVLHNLAQEAAAEKDETKQISVENVQTMLGYGPSASAAAAPVADPNLLALKNENDELKRAKAQQDAAQRDAFIANVGNEAKAAILKDIVDRFVATRPTGMDDDESKRCVEEAFTNVGKELLANANFVRDFDSFRNGDTSQRGKELAVRFALERAKSFIPIHLNAAIAFYGKRALSTAEADDVKQKKAAAQPDAAKVGGVAPSPTPAPNVMDRLKANRQKGQRFSDAIFATLSGA